MVVALTALFLALGGSAYALVITGKTIRNNTVTGKDIRNGTLKARTCGKDSLGGGAIKESSPRHGAGLPESRFGGARFAVVTGGRHARARPQRHLGGAHRAPGATR